MQSATPPPRSASPGNFASMLAALASPKSAGIWEDDELADDVATLSYESALRAHTRYRAADRDARSPAAAAAERPCVDSYEPASAEAAEAAPGAAPLPRAQKKTASVTIRMSQEEADQLHRRAAEAGLTVSAYLRSCTFEAESLRALVKETMAQLKAATAAKAAAPLQQSAANRRLAWLTPWRDHRRSAGA